MLAGAAAARVAKAAKEITERMMPVETIDPSITIRSIPEKMKRDRWKSLECRYLRSIYVRDAPALVVRRAANGYSASL